MAVVIVSYFFDGMRPTRTKFVILFGCHCCTTVLEWQL